MLDSDAFALFGSISAPPLHDPPGAFGALSMESRDISICKDGVRFALCQPPEW